MLAAHHDQENQLRSQLGGNGGRHRLNGNRNLPPKTPGARYPNTPLKVPLNDENAVQPGKSLLAGRSRMGNENTVLKGKGTLQATPSEARTRTVLGNKTTNAKARTGGPAGGAVKEIIKQIEQTQTHAKPTTIQKPKPMVTSGPAKVEVLAESKPMAGELDVEYGPPRLDGMPYQSDVFPDGVLTFEGVKPANLLKGYYSTFYNPIGDDGLTLKEREFNETMEKALAETDERIRKDIDEFDWSVSDVPETKKKKPAPKLVVAPDAVARKVQTHASAKYPATVASKKAATSLSIATEAPKARALKPLSANANVKKSSFLLPGRKAEKELPRAKSAADLVVSETASRSTIGYTKGRSASSIVHGHGPGPVRAPAPSVREEDRTITPASFSQGGHQQEMEMRDDVVQRLPFLSIFDIEEDDEADEMLRASISIPLEDVDEEFELKLID